MKLYKKKKFLLIIFLLIIFYPIKAFCQQGWPVWSVDANGNKLNKTGIITDVFSSGRDIGNRDGLMDQFHGGVDIAVPEGTAVFSITNGTVDAIRDNNTIVDIELDTGEFLSYGHLKNIQVNKGETVTTNTKLGEIGYHLILYHLHFDSYTPNVVRINPFRPNGPLEDIDTPGTPSVPENEIYFRKDDNIAVGGVDYTNIDLPILYGKIDIVCRAYDPTGVTNKQSQIQDAGVMQLRWKIDDTGKEQYILKDGKWDGAVDNSKSPNLFNENDIPTIQGKPPLLANTDDDKQEYFYIITNSTNLDDGGVSVLDKAGYWNTKLKKGEKWNGADAIINSEAQYPDGKHKMFVRAGSDIDTDLGNWSEKEIILDNHFPYPKQLTVWEDKGSGNQDYLYSSHWILDTTSPSPKLKQEWTVNRPVIFGLTETEKTYNVEVQFSEDMKSAEAKIVFKDSTAGSPPTITLTKKDTTKDFETDWVGNFKLTGNSGAFYLKVKGFDSAGHDLDQGPETIAYRDPTNPATWLNFDAYDYEGWESNHLLNDFPPFLQQVIVTGTTGSQYYKTWWEKNLASQIIS